MTLSVSHPRAKQRWALLVVIVVATALAFAAAAQGLSQTQFELDKNATDDLTTIHQGTLKGSISSTATQIDVCQLQAAPAPNFTILIDAEQLRVTAVSALPGNGSNKLGGCAFSNPADVPIDVMRYTVVRGVDNVLTPASDPTTAASHPGASDVTILVTGATAGDDWDDVYASVLADGPTAETHTCDDVNAAAVACLFVADGGGESGLTDQEVFHQGGSKDDLNINPLAGEPGTGWKWTQSSVPPSDEILDAFAIKYDTGTRQLLFFGADRWSTNGAKDMGFWFFHDTVSRIDDPADPLFGQFEGNHTRPSPGTNGIFCNQAGNTTNPICSPRDSDDVAGDILLLSTFTQGGAVTSIRVFEWVGVGGNTNGTLQSIGAFGDCVPGNATDAGCNTVTNTTIPSPWPYQGAGSTDVANVIYTGGMAEGGIDLTALGLQGCFGSMLAETRSSPEPGAQLKDFALGNFEECGATITTALAGTTPFEIGGSISDTATVNITGGGPAPTGFVDFYVCGPEEDIATCDAAGTAAGHINLNTAVVSGTDYTVTSNTITPASAGDYCFYAEYPAGQDTNYPDGAFLTDFTDECFTVTPRQPNVVTNATDGPVTLGTSLDDSATLSGTANQPDGDPAGGTITFTAYGPHDDLLTCTTVAYTSVVTVSGNGTYTASDGDGGTFTPTVAGTYNWIAVYSGDPPNTLGDTTACGDADEGTVVNPNQPNVVTNATDGPVPLGTSLDDVATLSGTAPQEDGVTPAGGTITFTAYGPHDDLLTCDSVAYTSVVTVSGDGSYTASTGTGGTFTPTAPGTYNWIAVYSGDPPNTLGDTTACGDVDEGTVVISLQPTMDTAQNFVPNDAATITVVDGNGDLQGTVVFQLFVDDADCSGTAAYTSDPIDIVDGVGTGQSKTVVSGNTTAYDADADFAWVVTFDSTKLGHEDVSSPCGNEISSITIDNGVQQPAPPVNGP